MRPPDGDNPILLWPFHEAPEEYRALSEHGGDEDWLMYVPNVVWGYFDNIVDALGNDVSKHEIVGFGVVYIGAHS